MRKAGNSGRINKQGEEAHSSVTPGSLCIYAFASLFSLNDDVPRVAVSDDKIQATETKLSSDWIISQTRESHPVENQRPGVLCRLGKATVSDRMLISHRLNFIWQPSKRAHPE